MNQKTRWNSLGVSPVAHMSQLFAKSPPKNEKKLQEVSPITMKEGSCCICCLAPPFVCGWMSLCYSFPGVEIHKYAQTWQTEECLPDGQLHMHAPFRFAFNTQPHLRRDPSLLADFVLLESCMLGLLGLHPHHLLLCVYESALQLSSSLSSNTLSVCPVFWLLWGSPESQSSHRSSHLRFIYIPPIFCFLPPASFLLRPTCVGVVSSHYLTRLWMSPLHFQLCLNQGYLTQSLRIWNLYNFGPKAVCRPSLPLNFVQACLSGFDSDLSRHMGLFLLLLFSFSFSSLSHTYLLTLSFLFLLTSHLCCLSLSQIVGKARG